MAGPIASKIQLPDDSTNTGKKNRTQTKVIGSDTVHEHFVINGRQAVLLGVYKTILATPFTVLASAQNGTSTGILWFHVPTAITNKKVRVRRVDVTTGHTTAFAGVSAPRVSAVRITFTGTASGAALSLTKVDATYPTAVVDIRTAVTGLTPSLVSSLGMAQIAGALTAVGAYSPATTSLVDPAAPEDEFWVFAPGEGFVLYQDTNGTTSDTRAVNAVLGWDEVDTA